MAAHGDASLGLLAGLLLFLQPRLSQVSSGSGEEDLPPTGAPSSPLIPQFEAVQTPPQLSSFPTACGRPLQKIVGGMDAEEGKWPWQVSVQIRNTHVCGGSLITAQWVLTAAHCIFSQFQYTVKMGDRSIYPTKRSMVVPIHRIIIHPHFSTTSSVINDLALLHLLYPVNFSTTIYPICVPEEAFRVEAGTRCWVTGWGKTREGGPRSEVLQEVDQELIHYEECNRMMQKALSSQKTLVMKGMLCGYLETMDSCQGDSGGPMSCELNKTWLQVGIVSWGVGCARKGHPGVYTDLGFYSKWVKAVVNLATCLHPMLFFLLLLLLLIL
ncbi:serine protease 42-like isoform X1 [Dipodomys merriami]|uniref:serine protease 42-like isoform X1 n=1 Tax=Dipodomys merriami TaxID=94247 RepID=UPI00384CDC85